MTLGEMVDEIGGGTETGRRSRRCRSAARSAPISRARCSTRRSTTRLSRQDGLIGHAGITVFDDSADMRSRRASRWNSAPSKAAASARPAASARRAASRPSTRSRKESSAEKEHRRCSADLCNTMKFGSLCALGGFTPYPVMSALNIFPEISARRHRLQPQAAE
jgi:formate dehydrogenase iron-sulfur subunit